MLTLEKTILKRDYEEMRALINSSQGHFCSATFVKANGDTRTMTIQPAKLKFEVKGDAASDQAKRAAETRARNNPHLMNVWSVDAKGIRSINLNTVSKIVVKKEAYFYE